MDLITSILTITVRAGTSLVLATIGEILTERSGILNLGIEGMMLMGAVTSFAVSYYTHNLVLALLVAAGVGMVLALIHAFLSVTMRANQVVSGLSITLFGTGFASFLGQRLGPESNNFRLVGLKGAKFTPIIIPGLSDIPIIGALFRQDIITYTVYVLIFVSWFFLFKTRPGLWLRSVGEDPKTADAMGIDVIKTKYRYTLIGGMLIALGGAHLSLSYTPGWAENLTGGRGWIVVALVIFSMWNPARSVWGALLFGGINAIQFRLQAGGTNIPASFLNMAPYIGTIIVLVVITWWETLSKKVGGPASLSSSYMREDK
ncbi:MAG TPA: ABC transporter permease [Spirochaetales bacterium]|nr:ABC transporter permease [Spirochaetales bacterium]HPS14542.1 ABC transporter permease [Spirochaetales bacterium]